MLSGKRRGRLRRPWYKIEKYIIDSKSDVGMFLPSSKGSLPEIIHDSTNSMRSKRLKSKGGVVCKEFHTLYPVITSGSTENYCIPTP